MVKRTALVFGLIFSICLVCASNVVAQEVDVENAEVMPVIESTAAEAPETVVLEPAQEKVPTNEWVWGEVVSVDKDNKQFVIKHLDYDTYEEVQTTLKVDDKTLLENATDLSEIKQGDHVTVDYKIADGINTAGLVVVDKKELTEASAVVEAPAAVETPAPAAETAADSAVEPVAEVVTEPVVETAQ